MAAKTAEWQEGSAAFADGKSWNDCPYDMHAQWAQWADWTCGHGEAEHEAFEGPQRDREAAHA